MFSSTAAVYGNPERVPIVEGSPRAPVNPYGATKLSLEFALEAYGQAHGLRWAALRYFNASGASPQGHLRESHEPETHLLPLVIDEPRWGAVRRWWCTAPITRPDGSCVRDYVHVCDLADAHLLALKALGEGKTLGAMNLGVGQGYSVLEVLAAAGRVVGAPVPCRTGERRAGDPPSLVADAARAQREIGFTPRRSGLDVILEDTLRSRR